MNNCRVCETDIQSGENDCPACGAKPDDEKLAQVGLLFVHGIGAQTRGQTLIDFGEPILHWIEDRQLAVGEYDVETTAPEMQAAFEELESAHWSGAEPSGAGSSKSSLAAMVRSHDTRLHDLDDPSAPAHSRITLRRQFEDGTSSGEQWVFAESWWAEQFSPPSYKDLVGWAWNILPWVLGSHFASQIRREWASRQTRERSETEPGRAAASTRLGVVTQLFRHVAWLGRLTSAWLMLVMALLLSVVMIPLLLVFLILASLPIPQLRSALVRVQLVLSSTLGDSYVFLDHPIEGASIVRQVREDLFWLARRCRNVAIVAHSQGGAVAHQALRGDVPGNLKLLFTFGSGLRKLEELSVLMRSGSEIRRSANITSVATFFFAALSVLILLAWLEPSDDSNYWGVVILLLVSFAFVIAGLLDYLKGIKLPRLERWLAWLKERQFGWVDCYASADPVPNGLVSRSAAAESKQIHNHQSILRDHNSYWENRDEFISLLIGELSKAMPSGGSVGSELERLSLSEELFSRARKRRRYRVLAAKMTKWVSLLAIGAAVAKEWEAWWALLLSSLWFAWGWLANLLSLEADRPPSYGISWQATGYLILALFAGALARVPWSSWNRREMMLVLAEKTSQWDPPILLQTGILFSLLVACGIWIGGVPSVWVFFTILLISVVPLLIGNVVSEHKPPTKSGQPEDKHELAEASETNMSKLLKYAFGLYVAGSLGWAAGDVLGTKAVEFGERIGVETLLGIEVASISPGLVGGLVAVLAIVAHAIWWLRFRSATGTDATG